MSPATAQINKYYFELVSSEKALSFWRLSPHATVFTHPTVLEQLSARVDWWGALRHNETLCLWPVTMPDGNEIAIPEFTYWVGPMWSPRVYEIAAHRWLAVSSAVYGGFIQRFVERYGTVNASLPLGLLDVRVFDWWNYHEPQKSRFKIHARYTARLRGLQGMTEQQITDGYRELRRRELRRIARAVSPERATDWTVKEITGLYIQVMGRHSIHVPESTEKQIAALLGLVSQGMGEVVAFRNSLSGELTSAVLLLEANGIANMVLNLTANRLRRSGIQAWTVHNSIRAAQARGIDVFDFNGANSPTRGDDKHSYGAAPELYFEIFLPGEHAF